MQVITIAVIGAGPVGRRIAEAAAVAGYGTILEDILPSDLRRAEAEVRSNLAAAIAGGALSQPQADLALARLRYATSVEDAARAAELVIEAVPEDIDSKIEIFTLLDKFCRPHTLLATNAVSTSIGDLAAMTFRPAQCIGMRFAQADSVFHSPAAHLAIHQADALTSPLEIVCGPETSPATLDAACEVALRMGRVIAVVRE